MHVPLLFTNHPIVEKKSVKRSTLVEVVIKDRRLTTHEVKKSLGIPQARAHHILKKDLGLSIPSFCDMPSPCFDF